MRTGRRSWIIDLHIGHVTKRSTNTPLSSGFPMSSTLSPSPSQAAPSGSRPEREAPSETTPMVTAALPHWHPTRAPSRIHIQYPCNVYAIPFANCSAPPYRSRDPNKGWGRCAYFHLNSFPLRVTPPRLFHSHNITHPYGCHSRSTPPLSLATDLDLGEFPAGSVGKRLCRTLDEARRLRDQALRKGT
ncbi:hypothetical protein BGW80DRAFT_122665 [Lactifluus volemus]|nr:hypothetical protein BGW80DRAFT_122665 [Lactifluus volemus]